MENTITSNSYRILVVDDDSLVLISTKMFLQERGYVVDTAQGSAEALAHFTERPHEYAALLVDYQMPGALDGAGLIRELLKVAPEAGIFAYSGAGTAAAVQATWSAGAVGFITKGDNETLLMQLDGQCRRFEETRTLPVKATAQSEDLKNSEAIRAIGMIGRSSGLAHVADQVTRYRKYKTSGLVLGDTGSGKELVARALSLNVHGHQRGRFLPANCAAFANSDLLESELFGHEKGAFTGADKLKRGIFEEAQDGTIFLDEIQCLTLEDQAKLLRALQEKRFRRVGGTQEIPFEARIIAAAKPNLPELASSGKFLADLYYRLMEFTILIPSLRDRREDIEPLVQHFVSVFCSRHSIKKSLRLKTFKMLEGYDWPGNVRELEHTISQLLMNCPGRFVEPGQLDAKFYAITPSKYLSWSDLEERHEREKRERLEAVLRSANSKAQAAMILGIPPQTLHSLTLKFDLYTTKADTDSACTNKRRSS